MNPPSAKFGIPEGFSFPAKAITLTSVFVFASVLGVVKLSDVTGEATGIWIANAIMVAAVMKQRRSAWPAILAASVLANILAGLFAFNFGQTIIFAIFNLVEVLLVAVPMRAFDLDRRFSRPNSLVAFYALAAGPAPFLTAILVAIFEHATMRSSFIWSAVNWYGSDALGLVIVVPPLMTVRWKALKEMFAPRKLAYTLLLLGVLITTMAIAGLERRYPLAFLFFPAVLLLTFQRGFAGGAIGLALAGIFMLARAVLGISGGVLSQDTAFEQVAIVQVFVAVIGLSVVLVGAALEERRRLEQGLANAIARAETSREEAVVAKDAAEKASRSKSMFLATMSHELRTPLNAVIGFAELMSSEVFGPLGDSRYREYSGVIQNAGTHLLDLINDILDMSKIEAGKHELDKENLSVDELVQDCLDLMSERALQGDVKLTAEPPPSPFKVYADRRAMKQILINIVSNAVKFTPVDGAVIVRARSKDGNFVLAVTDTGVGIPADQIYRLGNPFVQLRNNAGATGKGTGLGLALVRALTEMHGGTFKIESVESHGTTVTVTIPLRETDALAA